MSDVNHQEDLFVMMNQYLSNPIVLAFYIIGVASVSFHLGNGLFNFAYKWGVTVNEKSQTWGMAIGLLVGLLFFVIGLRALLGFII
jgi:succinate dehydrogenase / fumarate reductase cytochrome b subunit